MDFISPLPVSVGELRQRILSRWCTLEEAVQVAQLPDRLTYFEMRRFLCEDASALQGPSSPEPVALALLSVPEECELPVTQPSRLEAGILKVFIKLCKDEQVDPAQCNASVSRQGLLFELSRFAAREGFRSWSSRALLTGEGAPVDSDLSEDAFCEVVVRQNGHLEDAQEWFDLLCPSTSTAKPSQAPAKLLEPAALTQQALSWPKLPGALDASEPWQLSELVVRLVSVWGDLTAAFGLDAVKEEEASTRGASPARASKDGVKSMAVQPAAPAVRRRRRLTTRQWLRALRGKPGRLLLSEMEARTESERLALLPHTVDRLFSNLSDRLLVTKNLWLPDELIPVRYSLSELGFWGCGGPAPLAVGRKLPLGRRPFITFVPSQPELAGFEDSTHPSRALVSPHVASGVAWLRAPKPPNGAELVSWHLQLFSSEDGVTPLVSVSQPLLIQVMSVPPAPPSEIILCDQTPDSLTLSWTESLQDGGLEVLHYELSLELEDAISINHADEPPVTITELEPEKTYVCCVRAINSLGAGPWSATWSFKTADPCAPPALRAPYVVQVGTSQAFLRWVPVGGFRVSKYLMKALKAVSATGPENADGVIQMCEGDQMDMLFTDLSSFTPYQFCIAACNSQGQGPWSNLTPEVFTEPDLPGQAEDVACVAERASLCVTWKPPKDEGGASVLEYMLRVKSMELDNPQVLEMSVGNSPAWISGLFGNCSYRISVAARNAAGLGCFVDVEGRTAVVPPNAPRALELFCAEADAVIVRWLPPGNDGGSPVLNYVVKVAGPDEPELELGCLAHPDPKAAGGTEKSAAGGPGGLQLPALRGATAYTVRVHACNKAGTSPAAEVTVRTGPTVPGVPEPPRVSRRPGQLKLRWEQPEDGGSPVLQYEVRVALSGDLTILAQLCVEGQEVKLAGLEPGCSYCAQLRARNQRGWGAWSRWSAPRSPGAVPGRPPAPRPLLQRTARSLLAEWDPPDSDTPLLEYEVWCGKEETFCHGIAPAEGRRTRTSRTVAKMTGLAPSSQYVFRVRALNVSGWSPWSAPSDPVCTMDAQSSEEIMSAVFRHFGTVGAAFRAFDRDRDGLVSREEFVTSLGLTKYRLGLVSLEQRAHLFCRADRGGSGFLSYPNFASLFGRASSRRPHRRSFSQDTSASQDGLCGPARAGMRRWSQVTPQCLNERLQQASCIEVLACSGSQSGSCNSSRASSPALRRTDVEGTTQPLRDRADLENRDTLHRCCLTCSPTKLPTMDYHGEALPALPLLGAARAPTPDR